MCGPKQLFFQCGPETPQGWTPWLKGRFCELQTAPGGLQGQDAGGDPHPLGARPTSATQRLTPGRSPRWKDSKRSKGTHSFPRGATLRLRSLPGQKGLALSLELRRHKAKARRVALAPKPRTHAPSPTAAWRGSGRGGRPVTHPRWAPGTGRRRLTRRALSPRSAAPGPERLGSRSPAVPHLPY